MKHCICDILEPDLRIVKTSSNMYVLENVSFKDIIKRNFSYSRITKLHQNEKGYSL